MFFFLVVLFLFLLKFPATLIVAASIPVCLVASFGVMDLAGRTLNVISLAGLAFSVGMVLDASIIILENIVRSRLELPEDALWAETPALLPAGGLSVHDRLTLHGSGSNKSGAHRRSLALHLRTQNSRPTPAGRSGLARHVDDLDACPVIHGPRER